MAFDSECPFVQTQIMCTKALFEVDTDNACDFLPVISALFAHPKLRRKSWTSLKKNLSVCVNSMKITAPASGLDRIPILLKSWNKRSLVRFRHLSFRCDLVKSAL